VLKNIQAAVENLKKLEAARAKKDAQEENNKQKRELALQQKVDLDIAKKEGEMQAQKIVKDALNAALKLVESAKSGGASSSSGGPVLSDGPKAAAAAAARNTRN